jgi:hypothetical protein
MYQETRVADRRRMEARRPRRLLSRKLHRESTRTRRTAGEGRRSNGGGEDGGRESGQGSLDGGGELCPQYQIVVGITETFDSIKTL